MLAPPDSNSPTMMRALNHTSNALDAAIELDVDRTAEDRAFFNQEKLIIDHHFSKVEAAHRAALLHDLREVQKHQARIVIGDTILDRGARRGKKRVAIETNADTADLIFVEDISEIVDAERHVEPHVVLQCVDRMEAHPDFAGKSALVTDLTGRAERQIANFRNRENALRTDASLEHELAQAISAAADALYTLEKRLLERFPRDKVYVRAFFFDVSAKRKKTGGE